MDERPEYFILDPSARVWWRHEGKGYDGDICHAGLFTKSKAERVVSGGRGDSAFHVLSKLDDLRRSRERHADAVDSADRILNSLVNVNASPAINAKDGRGYIGREDDPTFERADTSPTKGGA